MIHTLQIMCRVRQKKAEAILADLLDDDGDIAAFFAGTVKEIEQDIYDHIGLNRIIIYPVPSTSPEDSFYIVNLVINPAVLASGRRTIRLFDCSDDSIRRLRCNFADRIKDLTAAKLPDLEKWSVHRIDYAFDIRVDRPDFYAKLGKRLKYPWQFGERYKGEGSAFYACKSVLLNFYDKLDQVRKKYRELSYFDELAEEARGIFRAEVQCEHDKIKAIRVGMRLPNTKTLSFLRPDIAIEIVQSYFERTFGREDFIDMDEAERRIAAASWQTAKKRRVLDMLQLVTHARRLPRAQSQYIVGTSLKNDKSEKIVQGTAAQFDGYIKDCRALGFSPVLLPRERPIEGSVNPYNDLQRAINELRQQRRK